MADVLEGVSGGINGIFAGAGGAFTQILILINLPLMIVWLILTAIIVWTFFFRRSVVVNPFWMFSEPLSHVPIIKRWVTTPWKYSVTLIRPFANLKTFLSKDIGALVNEDGIRRFKLKTEQVILQKPDTTDVYPNGEIPIVSLGPSTKLMARRTIDYERHTLTIDVENPQIASLYSADRVESADPDWLLTKFRETSMMLTFWVIATACMMASNLLVFYPILTKILYWGG